MKIKDGWRTLIFHFKMIRLFTRILLILIKFKMLKPSAKDISRALIDFVYGKWMIGVYMDKQ